MAKKVVVGNEIYTKSVKVLSNLVKVCKIYEIFNRSKTRKGLSMSSSKYMPIIHMRFIFLKIIKTIIEWNLTKSPGQLHKKDHVVVLRISFAQRSAILPELRIISSVCTIGSHLHFSSKYSNQKKINK